MEKDNIITIKGGGKDTKKIMENQDSKKQNKAISKLESAPEAVNIFGKQAYLNPRVVKHASLNHQGRVHKRAIKKPCATEESPEVMAKNAIKFSMEKLCRLIAPATLKPRAGDECVNVSTFPLLSLPLSYL